MPHDLDEGVAMTVCRLCKKNRVENGYSLCGSCHETGKAASMVSPAEFVNVTVPELMNRVFMDKADYDRLQEECDKFQRMVESRDGYINDLRDKLAGFAKRIAAQSETLSQRAEKYEEKELSGHVTREMILDHAREIVTKHRQNQYGTPEDNFSRIALMWSAHKGVEFTPYDVAVMMILLKIVRSKNSPTKADHYTDMAGYAACAAEVSTKP